NAEPGPVARGRTRRDPAARRRRRTADATYRRAKLERSIREPRDKFLTAETRRRIFRRHFAGDDQCGRTDRYRVSTSHGRRDQLLSTRAPRTLGHLATT